MKVTNAQVASFLKAPPLSARVVLIYGEDQGLVSERARILLSALGVDKNDPFAVTHLTSADLKDAPFRLADEAATPPLGGGRRLVRLQGATESAAAGAVDAFLKNPPPGDGLVVIEAGDLDKRSRLRALCEGAGEGAAALACYPDDESARIRTIETTLRAEGLSLAREALELLNESLPTDRLALRAELEKLALYVGAPSAKTVSVADVRAVIAGAGQTDGEALAEAALAGDVRKTDRLLALIQSEQTSSVALLRTMQRHLLRLQQARALIAQGLSVAEAIRKLVPSGIVWKVEKSLTMQIKRWPLERIEARLFSLAEAEAACKRTGTPDAALVSRLILHIAAKA